MWLNVQRDLYVCVVATNAATLFALLAKVKPDVLIADLSLRGCDGVELIKDMRAQGHTFPIIVYTMHAEELYARAVFNADAQGYVTKDTDGDALVTAIRRVLNGHHAFSENALRLIADPGMAKELNALADREREVFALIAERLNARQIAERLHISQNTVTTYQTRIKDKLGLATSKDLYATAILYAHRGQTPSPAPPTDNQGPDAWVI
jgi:DNA-binding NarL/FixJ family response regulator